MNLGQPGGGLEVSADECQKRSEKERRRWVGKQVAIARSQGNVAKMKAMKGPQAEVRPWSESDLTIDSVDVHWNGGSERRKGGCWKRRTEGQRVRSTVCQAGARSIAGFAVREIEGAGGGLRGRTETRGRVSGKGDGTKRQGVEAGKGSEIHEDRKEGQGRQQVRN
ncbi:hypothetical protein ERJ75_000346000 [Trypanosoma vivax]|nr:hypothetical protein ERJ75_000346000 [Trypanosoma vivax]